MTKSPPGKALKGATQGDKGQVKQHSGRGALIWNDPTVPSSLREAYRPVLPESEADLLSDNGRRMLECDRQEKIHRAHEQIEERFLQDEGRVTNSLQIAALSNDATVGRKVREGGQKGHQRTYGKADDISERHASYASDIEALRRQHPKFTLTKAYAMVAEKHGVSPKTIYRACRRAQITS